MQQQKFLKYLSSLIILVAVFLVGVSFGRDSTALNISSKQGAAIQNTTSKASLMIDYGNGKVQTFSGLSVSPSASVFDLLKTTLEKNNLVLVSKNYGGSLGQFIESIGGIGKDPTGNKWWQYWVNNSYSTVGVSGYTVKPGDVIEFKFTSGQQ